MIKKLLSVVLIVAMLVTVAICLSPQNSIVLEAKADGTVSDWRCAVISFSNSLVTQYKYDSNGKVAEIIEFQNEGSDDDNVKSVSFNRISFNEKGNISAVTTNADGMSAEIIDAKTWRSYSDSYSFTVSYNDLYLIDTQIVDVVDGFKSTTKTNYDANGKAISEISETEVYGDNQKFQSVTVFEYEYDCNGNPVIQYALTEHGKQIVATYSWEH